jgi:hypothetical protein
MILVDLDKSYQNHTKITSQCQEKSGDFWDVKNPYDLSHTTHQGLSESTSYMTLHDLPFIKIWSVKKFIFSDFGHLKGITGAIRNGNMRSCVHIMIEDSKSYHNQQ